MGVGFYHQVEDSRAGLARMVSVPETEKDRFTLIIAEFQGGILRKGLRSLVELETSENMNGNTLALKVEELAVACPVDESYNKRFVELALEKHGRSILRGELGSNGVQGNRVVAFKYGYSLVDEKGAGGRRW